MAMLTPCNEIAAAPANPPLPPPPPTLCAKMPTDPSPWVTILPVLFTVRSDGDADPLQRDRGGTGESAIAAAAAHALRENADGSESLGHDIAGAVHRPIGWRC